MLAMGFMEFVIWGLMLGPLSGAFPNDLASLLTPEAYFQHTNVPVQTDKLIDLAAKAPADAKGRLTQLMAVRWLGENAAKLGDHKKAAQGMLQKLAQGQQGFARDYAARALARIDGQPLPALPPAPRDSMRQALEWFPDDVTFVAALELRPTAGQKGLPEDAPLVKDLRSMLTKFQNMMGPQGQSELFKFADAVGNVRIDRYSVAFDAAPPKRGERRIMMRATGAGDGKALLEYFQLTVGGTIKEEKGPKGESIVLLTQAQPPVLAVIDNTDLILTGYDSSRGDHAALLREILDVRAGKKPSVLKGPLAKDLEAVRPETRGLVAGTVPVEMRRELAGTPLGVAPERVVVELGQLPTATSFALTVGFRGTMEKEADAKALIDGFNTLKLMAVKQLDELAKPKDTLALKKAIQGAVLKSDGANVTGGANVSAEAIQAGLRLMLDLVSKDFRP